LLTKIKDSKNKKYEIVNKFVSIRKGNKLKIGKFVNIWKFDLTFQAKKDIMKEKKVLEFIINQTLVKLVILN
jgi:hypothetical protein